MFNYLMITEIILNKIITESSPDLKHITIANIIESESKRDAFIKYVVDNQIHLFGETKLKSIDVDTLLNLMKLIGEYNNCYNKDPKYNNGNLSILPLKTVLKTTNIHSLSTFISNLINIDCYYRSNFVEENYYDWANKLLNDLYMKNKLTDVLLLNEVLLDT